MIRKQKQSLLLILLVEDPKKKILWAAENNHLDILKSLLEEDKSLVSSKDGDGYSPLHRAAYNGHTDVINVSSNDFYL